jgi:tetratricopeptide (TPR) repeat protein
MPGQWPVWKIAGSGAVLALVSGWVVWRARARRYLVTGWLWFLGMLVPVIGLVQTGTQSMADRYHYLPGVGLFIMGIWAAGQWGPRLGARAPLLLGGLAVAGCLVATPLQVRYWKNSVTLFARAAETTPGNYFIECGLGGALYEEGRLEEAMEHLRRALVLAPDFAQTHYVLGNVLLRLGRVDEAILHFQTALQIQPDSADYHRQMGRALSRARRLAEAVRQYETVLQIRPDDIQAAGYLAWVLASNPDPSLRDGPRAVELALRANRLSGGQDPDILGTLAVAYADVGEFPDAIATARLALQMLDPAANSPMADALRAQIALYQSGQPFRDTGPAPPTPPPRSP